MPITPCPHCGKDVQFPDYFHGNEISCPNPACQKPVLLPYVDGTFPTKEPPKPVGPQPAAAYYLRKPDAPELVVGPLPRQKVRQMALQQKLMPTDQLSEDRKKWRPAMNRDPDLFKPQVHCARCGAVSRDDSELCPRCANKPPEDEEAGGTYDMNGRGMRVRALTGSFEHRLTAPVPLFDFRSAHSADAILGVGFDGWIGLWSARGRQPVRSWRVDLGPRTLLAVADNGGLAVVATGGRKSTRLDLIDFESKRPHELTEIDGEVQALGLDPTGKYMALVDHRPDVRIYKVDPWKRLDKIPVEGDRFEFCLAADRLAAAHEDGSIAVWNLQTGKVERELLAPGRVQACPQLPLRMAFSRTGKRLFAASGLVVQFPKKNVDGIGGGKAFLIGAIPFGLMGGVAAAIVNNNVPVIWERIRNSREAGLENRLAQGTALRAWELDRGGMTGDMWYVFEHHPTGIADAFFYPFGSAAVTLGETSARAWDVTTGGHLGPIYDVVDPTEVRRAREARLPELCPFQERPSLIRRVDFTYDGEHALVLVWGDPNIRMVPWPKEAADQSSGFVGAK
jgi:hypothetical protein